MPEIIKGKGQIKSSLRDCRLFLRLMSNRKSLLVEFDGLTKVAKSPVGQSQIAERGPLATPVTDLLGERDLVLIALDRFIEIVQGIVGVSQIAKGVALATAVADFFGDGEAEVVKFDGCAEITKVKGPV